MFISGLVQYASADNVFSSNLRFRWEYQPGSELFVVYTDERDTTVTRLPGLAQPRIRGQSDATVPVLGLRIGDQRIDIER